MRSLALLAIAMMAGCCSYEPHPMQTTLISYSSGSEEVENPFDVPLFIYLDANLYGAVGPKQKTMVLAQAGKAHNITLRKCFNCPKCP